MEPHAIGITAPKHTGAKSAEGNMRGKLIFTLNQDHFIEIDTGEQNCNIRVDTQVKVSVYRGTVHLVLRWIKQIQKYVVIPFIQGDYTATKPKSVKDKSSTGCLSTLMSS